MAAISSPCSLKVALPTRITSSSRRGALRAAVVSRQAAPKVAAGAVVSKEQLALAAPVVAAALTTASDANAAEVVAEIANNPALPLLATVFGIFFPVTFLIILYIKSKSSGEVN